MTRADQSTPSGLRSDVGVTLDVTINALLGVIQTLALPRMQEGEFYVGNGSVQSAPGIAQSIAETVETLMRARRLA